MKIKVEILKQWIAALRSKKYKQANGALRSRTNKFCCLGVLCDIVKEPLSLEWDKNRKDEQDVDSEVYYLGNASCLPPDEVDAYIVDGKDELQYNVNTDIARKFATPQQIGRMIGLCGAEIDLTDLNDDYGFTLEQIADIIEADNADKLWQNDTENYSERK